MKFWNTCQHLIVMNWSMEFAWSFALSFVQSFLEVTVYRVRNLRVFGCYTTTSALMFQSPMIIQHYIGFEEYIDFGANILEAISGEGFLSYKAHKFIFSISTKYWL